MSLLAASVATAAPINYGNSPNLPPGITFINVTESSGTDAVPLYGAPGYFNTGIDFDPTSFVASGTAGSGDITDGQLNFGVVGNQSPTQIVAINDISVTESGDRSLFGAGTTATQLSASVSIKITVLEVDGVAVTPLVLPQANASVSYNLIANPGVAQPWALGLNYDIDAALTAALVPYTYGATEIEVVIDDTLIALSEPSSAALIAKKDFAVELDGTLTIVPEPATASLAALATLGVLLRRRRSR
ncbi:MAG: PEP-CTERM sorting domain-containing protein [Tepidisphaeraceae bacterium]